MNINIKLKDFDLNAGNCLKRLYHETDFTDVTLVCEEAKQLKAHKVILSTGSEIFKTILQNNPHPHILVFLRNIPISRLENILKFLYFGQVDIPQNEIDQFLSLAEDLKVNGLAGKNISEGGLLKDNYEDRNNEHDGNSTLLLQKNSNMDEEINKTDDNTLEGNALEEFETESPISEEVEENLHETSASEDPNVDKRINQGDITEANNEDQEKTFTQQFKDKLETIERMFDKVLPNWDGIFNCEQCHYTTKWKCDLVKHFRSRHEPLKCNKCPKELTTIKGMKHHQSTVHDGIRFPCKFCPHQATNVYYMEKHVKKYHASEISETTVD